MQRRDRMSETDNLFESIVDKKEPVQVNQRKVESKKIEKNQSQESLPEGKVLVDQSTLNQLLSRISQLENAIQGNSESGNPSIEWAKLKAKEKAARKEKSFKDFYTQKDGKILLVTIKSNGAYSSYIGNGKKHKEQLKPLIARWKKDGVWIEEHEAEEFISKTIIELEALGE